MQHYGYFGLKRSYRKNLKKTNHIGILSECQRGAHNHCVPLYKNRLGGTNICLCECHTLQHNQVKGGEE